MSKTFAWLKGIEYIATDDDIAFFASISDSDIDFDKIWQEIKKV